MTVEFPDWTGQGVEPAVFEVPINEELSQRGEATYVMFHNPEIRIEDAVNVLRKHGLDVFIRPEALLIYEDGAPAFSLRLVRGAGVQQVASALGQGTAHAADLNQCNARFEVVMVEPEKTLKDPATLREIQLALQELTRGYLYHTWDKRLTAAR